MDLEDEGEAEEESGSEMGELGGDEKVKKEVGGRDSSWMRVWYGNRSGRIRK